MGDRINYVIKTGDQLTVYYHRWGATSIAADLYPGEESFLRYLSECNIETELKEHLWMEGLVMLDIEKKLLGFWAWSFENETSVIRYYLSALQNIWPDWQIIHLANEMYDAEPLLGVDYLSKQKIHAFKSVDAADIINDPLSDECPNVLFIIRQNGNILVAETVNIMLKSLICYGEDVIPLLSARPAVPMPVEGTICTPEHLFIDADNKKLIINHSIFGLWETMGHKWPGYTLKMGHMGYLAMLEEANIPTTGLEMPQEEIQERFAQMITQRDI